MGRAKREVPTGKLFLKYPKNEYDKDKCYTLYYYYSFNRKNMARDTQIRVKVKDWNPYANNGIGALRPSYGTDYNRCNNQLHDYIRKTDGKIQEYNIKHPRELTPEIVHSILFDEAKTRNDEGKDFVEFVKTHLSSKLNLNKIGQSRYENGVSAMKIFQEFLKAKGKGTYKPDSIYLGEISGDLLDEYITYRKDVKGNKVSTINHSLTPIISACEQACRRGYISESVFADIEEKRIVDVATDDKFDGKFLSKEQLKQLVNFYTEDTETRRKEYIEMFLFAFHAGGLRIIDILTLEWKHIDFEKREMKKVLIKTAKYQKQRHLIPLTDSAIKILQKWKDMGRTKRYVFDLLADSVDVANQATLYDKRNSVTRKVNQALHVVGEKIKLPFSLTFHVARHSFAINALNDETHPLDMYQVSRLLGHASTAVTEKVYADYTREFLGDKLRELNFNFVPDLD